VISAAVTSDNRFGRTAATKSSARCIYQRRAFAGIRSRTSSSTYRPQPEGRSDSWRVVGLLAEFRTVFGPMVSRVAGRDASPSRKLRIYLSWYRHRVA
jgi:hypothetical protein